jgi:exodeoxyribonuclease-3
MKLATYNVNSIRIRIRATLDWLKANTPDVLCLQETKVTDDLFPAAEFESAGYHCIFRGQKSYNGVAILSRLPLSDIAFGFDDAGPPDETRLVKARVNGIAVVNTYVPQGYLPESEKFQYKLEWFRRLRVYFEKNFSADDLVVWCGDLNVAPEAIDVYNPVALAKSVDFHPLARQALRDTMSFGFTDCFRHFHPDQPGQYTYWDYRFPKFITQNQGWRIDHIMVTKPLLQKCSACEIDPAPRLLPNPSDHTCLVAEFRI